ncbi:MAG: DUF5916 domain-containing protein [Thermoanaerobaculia bacterium]
MPAAQAAAQEQVPIAVRRIEEPITVDGVLDEAAWQTVEPISLPWEWFPADNAAAPVDTEVLLAYDSERLYVAFRAHDPDPARIRARFADRDIPFDDDTVGFMVDPFGDRRRALQFRVNPLGVQMDAINNDVEQTEDFSWDAIWESAGRITDTGYVVEVALPFRQLRFPRTTGAQTWGFLAMRDYPRSLRHRMRSIRTDQNRECLVCQFQQITGLEGMTTGRNLEVNPTLTGLGTEARPAPATEFETVDESLEPGLFVDWGPVPSLSLSGTVNPDFSQVEADAAQLDVNTRFALFFPEKRPFFLEGADLFETRLPLVFTRTVGDPEGGLKLTGKEGAHGFGAFVARDRINNLILPGPESSDLASVDDDLTSGVLRWRRDVGEASALGLLYTGREGSEYSNHVLAGDGVYRFTDSELVRFQLAGSVSRYPDELETSTELPQGSFDDYALALNFTHDSRDWLAFASYDDYGPGFRADSGFLPQVGVRAAQAGVERQWRGSEEDWFSNLFLFFGVDGLQEHHGNWNEWGSDLVFVYLGPLQSQFEIGLAPNQEFFDGVTYHNFRQSVSGLLRPSGAALLELDVNWGETIDFANSRQADFVTVSPSLELKLGRRFQSELSYDRQVLDVAAGRLFTLDLAQTRVLYHLNRRAFFRAILQYRDLHRNLEVYTFPVDETEESLLTQLLFSYKLNARTALLAGYSDGHLGTDAFDLTQTDRTLFLKLSYAWLL